MTKFWRTAFSKIFPFSVLIFVVKPSIFSIYKIYNFQNKINFSTEKAYIIEIPIILGEELIK